MKLTFKQGIVKSQVDSNNVPTFLHKNPNNDYISLYVNASSTLVSFSHGTVDYLYEEANIIEQTWGPFPPPVTHTYYLYWDISVDSGVRTFGHTILPPIVSATAPNLLNNDQHWFNLSDKKMYVYQDFGWVEKLRVFAGLYSNNSLLPYSIIDENSVPQYFTSQVGLYENSYPGFILFDDNDNAIKRTKNNTFLTTESQFYTTKSNIGTVSFDTVQFYATAIENIPAYRIVSYYKDNTISTASYNDPDFKSAIGFIRTEVYKDEVSSIVTNGYITNIDWHFNVPPSTSVYLGMYGTLQMEPPRSGFIQKIGTVVSHDTIFINIEPQIIYTTEDHTSASIPINVDILSGKLYTAQSADSVINNPIPDPGTPTPEPSASSLIGFTYIQNIDKRTWTMTHGKNTENVFLQVYNKNGDFIIPNSIHTSLNSITATFNEPCQGYAQAVLFLTHNYINLPNNNVPITEFIQTIPSDTWVIEHYLGYNPITRVYVDNILVQPDAIIHDSVNKLSIKFDRPLTGLVRFI